MSFEFKYGFGVDDPNNDQLDLLDAFSKPLPNNK